MSRRRKPSSALLVPTAPDPSTTSSSKKRKDSSTTLDPPTKRPRRRKTAKPAVGAVTEEFDESGVNLSFASMPPLDLIEYVARRTHELQPELDSSALLEKRMPWCE